MSTSIKKQHDLSESNNFLAGVSVVLVEPKDNRNIGVVIRTMDNFGIRNLKLVAPKNYDPEQVKISACWADTLIPQIEIYDDLRSALASFQMVVGFSSDYGKSQQKHISISEWLVDIESEQLTFTNNLLALVFGSEDQGLRNEHVQDLSCLIRIPSNSANPSLNLAQAVTIVLYELSKFNWSSKEIKDLDLANWQSYDQLEKFIDSLMQISAFKNEHTSPDVDRVMHAIFRRLKLDRREMAMLLGLLSKIEKVIKNAVN